MNQKSVSRLLMAGLLCVLMTSPAWAADQTQKRDRKKDGSCQTQIVPAAEANPIAKNQVRSRDRKKDGSCQAIELQMSDLVAKDQLRTRDRKKDGSCQS